MSQQYTSQPYPQLYSGTNYTSQFFGNFIDNSQFESSSSSISRESSVINYEQQNGNDFSVNQEKVMQFQLQNLIFVAQTIAKRMFIHRWVSRKESLKKLEGRTPECVTKTLLKVFYSISIKLQVKYSFAFRKMVKIYQEAKSNSDRQISQGGKADVGGNSQTVSAVVSVNEPSKQTSLKTGLNRLQDFFLGLRKRQFFDLLIEEFSLKRRYLEFIAKIFEEDNEQLVAQGWQAIRGWLNYLDKIEILEGTLNLQTHQKMRQAFWILKIQRPTLEYNDISNIQQQNSRKQSYKMNNSTESISIQKELLESSRLIDLKSSQEQDNDAQQVRESCHFKKKDSPEFVERNNPRHLKFSKDVKRKTAASQYSNMSQQEIDEQMYYESPQNFQITPSIAHEGSTMKHPNEDISMNRRESMTMNTSICQSRSVLKKMLYPLEIKPDKTTKIKTLLIDDDFPLILNDGYANKQFQNNSKVTKVKTLKHEQFRKEFTDFNDLFSVREIIAFYQGFKTSAQESRKGISLARIKEKVNLKTQEEYYSKRKQMTMIYEERPLERIVSEPKINIGEKIGQRSPCDDRTFNSIRANNSQVNYSKQRLRERKAQFRIPSELPTNFDYYVDKSLKRQPRIGKASPDLLPLSIQADVKRKSMSSRSRKKLQFNVVKSGSNRISGQHQQRKKKSLQPQINKATSLKPKLELNIKKSSRQKKYPKEQKCPHASNEYLMTFRDPPKKKVKKNMMKNDL